MTLDAVQVTWIIFPLFYVIPGTVFNFFTFVSVVFGKFPQDNIAFYYCIIIFADSLALCGPLLAEWMKMTFQQDIKAQTPTGCTFNRWLSAVVLCIPPWVLVIMAFENRSLMWLPAPISTQLKQTVAKRTIVFLIFALILLFSIEITESIRIRADKDFPKSRTENVTAPLSSIFEAKWVCETKKDYFLLLYKPWLQLSTGVLTPMVCLIVYHLAVFRKIVREKWCAQQLLLTLGILPPYWFYHSVMDLEKIMKKTGLLTLVILITSSLYSIYLVIQPRFSVVNEPYSPSFWLMSNLMFFLNYSYLFPFYILFNARLIIIMQDIWNPDIDVINIIDSTSDEDPLPPEDRIEHNLY